MKNYFVTGIGTDVGKSIVSAVLVEKLQADYWKPIQTGSENSDRPKVASLVTNEISKFHREAYSFIEPKSPHIAASAAGKEIDLKSIEPPHSANENLVIEGAGGVLVPVNRTSFVIELVSRFDAEVVLVVRNYLGCINHSLLTLHYLLHHNYRLKGLVLNGDFESGVREVICDKFNLPVLLEIPEMEKIGKIEISKLSTAMKW